MGYRKKGTAEEEAARLLELLQAKAVSHGGSLLTTDVHDPRAPVLFQCGEGHKFSATPRNVLDRDGWCKPCRYGAPKDIEAIRASLNNLGLQFVEIPESLTGKIHVRCIHCGHERIAGFKRLISQKCLHKGKPKSELLLRLQAEATRFGGELISSSVATLDDYLEWKCAAGHTFNRPGNDLVNRNRFCSECQDTPITLEKIRKRVLDRGGKLIDWEKGIALSKAKLDVQCSRGHMFEIDWNHMSGKRGGWCSICSKGSKSEEVARTTFKQLFGGEFKKRRPKWLKNSRGKQMELDGYEESLKLAFEYQGQQHFQEVSIYNNSDSLKVRIADDEEKRRLCKLHDVTLIELRWDEKFAEFPASIEAQLKAQGRQFSEIDFRKKINLDLAYIKDDRLKELKDILSAKQITLISKKWIDVSTKYELLCDVCGHRWKQQGRAFLNTGYKPGCKRCAMMVTAKQMAGRKLGLDALQEYATSFGGKCLSTSYLDSRAAYEWVCEKGHKFSRNFDGMKSKKSFCPTCGLGKGTDRELEEFAKRHGGKWLSKEFIKGATHYKWSCSKGHEFIRTYNQMKTAKQFCVACEVSEKGLEVMNKFAAAHEGTLISETFTTNTASYQWRCINGHTFQRQFALMKAKGTFCNECTRTRRGFIG